MTYDKPELVVVAEVSALVLGGEPLFTGDPGAEEYEKIPDGIVAGLD